MACDSKAISLDDGLKGNFFFSEAAIDAPGLHSFDGVWW